MRKIILIIFLAASVLALAGCQQQSDQPTTTPAATNAPPAMPATNAPMK
ncbi:MAG TPA: hypothetical protein VGY98_19810 [Verrucomicrobiae bacterium]|nr:hypothetical protein [Verrucomicrobiae bacterium]